MLPSRQDSNNHYDAPNNTHIQRAYRVETNNINNEYASIKDSYSPSHATSYSRDNNYASTRPRVSTNSSDAPRERANFRNNNDEHSVVFRNNQFRDAEGNSEGFESSRITDRAAASNTRIVSERQRQFPSTQQPSYAATYASQPIRQTVSANGRTCVLDISITISAGGQPRINATSSTPRLPAGPTTTATYDNVRYVDLELRSPQNTATFTTDGNVHRS
ncbi:unnamed protein product [Adineta ricciae]|uniref:Uncharacterized protein n=1 Tax=Adineta ricciae TaxID=249248 RepID=A0A813N1N8_ADIRI|nr:unnamed protein product [Adineta ricciae]CAF1580851.1 unnamed protein product [Adineta ricciae]